MRNRDIEIMANERLQAEVVAMRKRIAELEAALKKIRDYSDVLGGWTVETLDRIHEISDKALEATHGPDTD